MKKGQGLTPLPEREVSGHGQERPGQFQNTIQRLRAHHAGRIPQQYRA